MKNREIRNLETDLLNTINAYDLPYELKRIVLEKIALQCERESNKEIINETITEKGELDNGTELD